MQLKLKKLTSCAIIPQYCSAGAACADLYAVEDLSIPAKEVAMVPLGFMLEVPVGYKFCIYSRSSYGLKQVLLANSVGIVDSDYRGEVKVLLYNTTNSPFIISKGERIAQCGLEVALPMTFIDVDELTTTARGSGGFGSTGR